MLYTHYLNLGGSLFLAKKKSKTIQFFYKRDIMQLFSANAKAITFVRRPKMKRDAWVKCCLFTKKKTGFHSGVSLHIRATNKCYSFRIFLIFADKKLKKHPQHSCSNIWLIDQPCKKLGPPLWFASHQN